MSNNVTLGVSVDTSQAQVELSTLMKQVDAATIQAREARRKILREISMATAAVSSMLSSFSMAMSLIGGQVDAFYGALIGMTLSTISMIISIATGLAATGVGIPAAAILMSVALFLNVATLTKLINEKLHNEGIWHDILVSANIASRDFAKTGPRTPTGGSF